MAAPNEASELNAAQRRVASRPEEALFVEAGAGSGKTRALAWRYANAVEGGGCRAADSAVAITFTEKAAGELAERIRRVLLARDDRDAARSVDAGWISTIHGLCARIVRRHALELGIDPRAAVMSEVQEGELKDACFEQAARASGSRGPEVSDLLAAYGVSSVRSAVIGVLDRLRAMGATVGDVCEEACPDLALSLREAVIELREAADAFAGLPDRTRTTEQNEASCRETAEALDRLSGREPEPEVVRELAEEFGVSARGADDLKLVVDRARFAVEVLSRDACDALADQQRCALLSLLAEYEQCFEGRKRDEGLLDFSDLLILTARLLRDSPWIAASYADRFRAVMVDEFQDTDPVQAEIIESLAGGRLCTVGDERQSIYGFRFADVEVFRTRRESMRGMPSETLAENYRSHPDILDFVNATFSNPALFGEGFIPLVTGRSGSEPPWADGRRRVRVVAVDPGDKGSEPRSREAALVASSVAEVLGCGAEPGDVAVLLRALTHADDYVDSLRAAGIPAYIEAGSSLQDSPEVRAVVDVLRVVANAYDEEALCAVLAGPLGGLSDAGLLLLASSARRAGTSLWDALDAPQCLSDEDHERAERIRQAIEGLRANRGRHSLGDIVRDAIETTDIDLALATRGSRGERALGALFGLARIAEEYEGAVGGDVAGLVRYLNSRRRYAAREPAVASGVEGSQSVRVMTVHAAKGLEFPFVVVPECGRRVPGENATVLVDRGTEGPRLGLKAPSVPERGLKQGETTVWRELSGALTAKALEEERRLLYVACTRAKEMLLVTGVTQTTESASVREAPIEWLLRAVEDEGVLDRLGEHDLRPKPIEWLASGCEGAGRLQVRDVPRVTTASPRPRSVSFTSLSELETCTYRFYSTRIAGLRTAGPQAGARTDLGTAVHRAVRLAIEGGLGQEHLNRLSAAHGLDPSMKSQLEAGVQALLSAPDLARAKAMPSFGIEVPFAIEVGAYQLVGSMDVYARDGDQALVIDHKTGASAGTEGEHELQAACYSLAAYADGADCVEVVFSHTDGGRIACEAGAGGRDDALARVGKALAILEAGRFEPLSRYRSEMCDECPAYRVTCSVRGPSRRR